MYQNAGLLAASRLIYNAITGRVGSSLPGEDMIPGLDEAWTRFA